MYIWGVKIHFEFYPRGGIRRLFCCPLPVEPPVMPRLRPSDDDTAPALGSHRARLEAQREYLDLSDEIREDDEDRLSPSYKHPVE